MSQNYSEDLNYRVEQGEIANCEQTKAYGKIGEAWHRFAPTQLDFFRLVDEISHLQERNKGVNDLVMACTIAFAVGLDYIFFHAPVDFFLKALVTSKELKILLTIAVLIGYVFFEIKACYTIDEAWEYSKDHPFDRVAAFKKWVLSIGGVAYGCIPAGLFYFVMMAALTDLSHSFVLLLCLMSVVTHLWLIFGGKSTIRSLNRFFGGIRRKVLNRKRHKDFKSVRKGVERARFTAQNFDKHEKAYLALGGEKDYFPERVESELVSSIYAFIEGGYYQVDPDELPFEFSRLFGKTRLGGGGNNRKFLR
jgi:hypothetical protein